MFKKILPIAMLVSLAACASTESYNIQSEMDEIDAAIQKGNDLQKQFDERLAELEAEK
jgi:hypothetical protein